MVIGAAGTGWCGRRGTSALLYIACSLLRLAAALAPSAPPEPPVVDLRPFERLFPTWCAQFRSGPGVGDYSYFPGHPTSVYGSADTLMSLSVLGRLNLTEADKDSWAVRLSSPLRASLVTNT
eukprot:COSAG05_NODE_3480_length_2034_cov_64.714212_2_plen_122_part_00